MTALYVHIPYCLSKCPYCDFASVPLDGSAWAYLDALAVEAERVSKKIQKADTVYIGGGTPTVLTPEQITWLLLRLRESFDISPDAEMTVEANPCSLSAATADAPAACGVNRVSLGAQSFVDAELSFLGRSHKACDVSRAFTLLGEAGMENISLDLIYAIPNQSPESWRYSLSQAIALEPQHISTYCLTFEPATPFWRSLQEGAFEKKSDDEELELYEIARETLVQSGYEHYEISNFALPGRRSRHNMVYWTNGEYLGLGAGAVSYIGGTRITNLREPEEYIRAVKSGEGAAREAERIPQSMQAIETAIQQLRLSEGIDCAAFADRFGVHPKDVFDGSFGELVEMGLLERTADAIKPSLKGWHLANEVALRALP